MKKITEPWIHPHSEAPVGATSGKVKFAQNHEILTRG